MGGALTQLISDTYHEKVNGIKQWSGVDVPPEELPPQCEKEFECQQPENPQTCPEYEYAEYKKLCNIK